jgi:hypothetical protein
VDVARRRGAHGGAGFVRRTLEVPNRTGAGALCSAAVQRTAGGGAARDGGARGSKARGRLRELVHALNSSADPKESRVLTPRAAAAAPRRPWPLAEVGLRWALAGRLLARSGLGRAHGLGPIR